MSEHEDEIRAKCAWLVDNKYISSPVEIGMLICEVFDAFNQLSDLQQKLADYERVIEESCVDDCGINLLVSHRNTLESIIKVTDLKAREVLAKYK